MSTSMGVFKFKRFDVVNERSAMKVNTDGVLLGAAMTVRPEASSVSAAACLFPLREQLL